MIVDMHSHIDLYNNPEIIIEEAKNHEIYIMSVTTTPKAWQITNKISSTNNKIRTALGFHPQVVEQRYKEIDLFIHLLPKTRYIGEVGLDGSREFKHFFDRQLLIFRQILKETKNYSGKILSIHSRNAEEIVLEEINNLDSIPILHWFSGNKSNLNKAIQQNCWFSIGLPMLLSKKGKEIVSHMPKNRIITETDGPFVTFNNNNLFPWDVEMIFPRLAELWNTSISETRQLIFNNFKLLIGN